MSGLLRDRIRLLLAAMAVLVALLLGLRWDPLSRHSPLAEAAPSIRLDLAQRVAGPWSGQQLAPGRQVDLPDVWRRQAPKVSGVHHYIFKLPEPAWAGGEALYVPRLSNRARFWWKGTLVAEFGSLTEGSEDFSARPLLVTLPPSAGGDARVLVVEVAGSAARFSGLSALHWGPAAAMAAAHASRDALLVGTTGLAAGGSLLLGFMGLALALWRRNALLAYFGVSGLASGTRALLWIWNEPGLPYVAWYTAMDACFGIWACSIAWFAMRSVGLNARLLEWALRLLMLCMPVATGLAALGWTTWPKEVWLDLILAVAGLITLALGVRAWQRPNGVSMSLALGALTVVVLSGADHWNIFFAPPEAYIRTYYSHHMALMFSLFMAAALAARFDQALRAEDHLRGDLQQQVQAQKEELQAIHQREQVRLSAEAAHQERQRIMQDMHDGLGYHLMGMLSQVRKGTVATPELASDIEDAIAHLRLAVDSAAVEEASLTDVVAQIRFRVSKRLESAGLSVHWDLQPTQRSLSAEQVSQVQKLMMEALANVLRHSQASQLWVTTAHEGVGALSSPAIGADMLRIRDNGVGMPKVHTESGNGLRNMHQRAQRLQAQLQVSSEKGLGTTLEVRLPMPP